MNRRLYGLAGMLLGFFVFVGPAQSADPGSVKGQAEEIEKLEEMIVTARTGEEYQAIAQFFEEGAKTLELRAERHEKLARQYQTSPIYGKLQPFMIRHCHAMASEFKRGSTESLHLAGLYRDLAAGVPGKALGKEQAKAVEQKMERIETLIPGAKTRKEQQALAQFYEVEAKELELEAERYERIAKQYEKSPDEKWRSARERAQAMARQFKSGAKESLDLARLHRQMAAEMR